MKQALFLMLLFVSSAYGETIHYRVDLSDKPDDRDVYVNWYLPGPEMFVQEWTVGTGYFTATLNTDTGEFKVEGHLTETARPFRAGLDPSWFRLPIDVSFSTVYPVDMFIAGNPNWGIDAELGGVYSNYFTENWKVKNYLGETVISSPGGGNSDFGATPDLSRLRYFAYIVGSFAGYGIEGGPTPVYFNRIDLAEVPEPLTLGMLLTTIPFFLRRKF